MHPDHFDANLASTAPMATVDGSSAGDLPADAETDPADPHNNFRLAQYSWGEAIRHDSSLSTAELVERALQLWETAVHANRVSGLRVQDGRTSDIEQKLDRFRQGHHGRTTTVEIARQDALQKVTTFRQALRTLDADSRSHASAERRARDAIRGYVNAEHTRIAYAIQVIGELGAPPATAHQAERRDRERLPSPDSPETWCALEATAQRNPK